MAFSHAAVEEWEPELEDEQERKTQSTTDGCAEYKLVNEIVRSLQELAECQQQR